MSLLVKHFVVRPRALEALAQIPLAQEEKQQLSEMVTLLYHQKLLNRFLEVLVEEDRKLFMEQFLNSDQEEAFSFLRERIADIEKVVEEAIFELEEKIIADFEELKGAA